jgi:UDP-N-acetylmuramyl pentapeptide phosphotransferase/UDP-N-acetylglucosamine-1-phosphate transferase
MSESIAKLVLCLGLGLAAFGALAVRAEKSKGPLLDAYLKKLHSPTVLEEQKAQRERMQTAAAIGVAAVVGLGAIVLLWPRARPIKEMVMRREVGALVLSLGLGLAAFGVFDATAGIPTGMPVTEEQNNAIWADRNARRDRGQIEVALGLTAVALGAFGAFRLPKKKA